MKINYETIISKLFKIKNILIILIIPRLILAGDHPNESSTDLNKSNLLKRKSPFVNEGETHKKKFLERISPQINEAIVKSLNEFGKGVQKECKYIIKIIVNEVFNFLFDKYSEHMNLFNLGSSEAEKKHEETNQSLKDSYNEYLVNINKEPPQLRDGLKVLFPKLSHIFFNATKLLFGEYIDIPHYILQNQMNIVVYNTINSHLEAIVKIRHLLDLKITPEHNLNPFLGFLQKEIKSGIINFYNQKCYDCFKYFELNLDNNPENRILYILLLIINNLTASKIIEENRPLQITKEELNELLEQLIDALEQTSKFVRDNNGSRKLQNIFILVLEDYVFKKIIIVFMVMNSFNQGHQPVTET